MDSGLIQATIYHPCLQALMKPTHVFKALVGNPAVIYLGNVRSLNP